MNTEEKDLDKIDAPVPQHTEEDQLPGDAISELEDEIIRNDTIPETSKDTPGSSGAFPVGAFDTSKD